MSQTVGQYFKCQCSLLFLTISLWLLYDVKVSVQLFIFSHEIVTFYVYSPIVR
jgi:hypothetical protein